MAFSHRDLVAAVLAPRAGAAYAADTDTGGGVEGGCEKPVFVLATIEVKPGRRPDFLRIFEANVPNVLAEDGCCFYEPVVDFDSGIPIQLPLRADVVTVVEKWASMDALRAHLEAPHMETYREQVKDLVAGVKLQVMRRA